MAELEQTTPTEPEPVVEQTTADDAEENYSNALQENIAKRGNNAYYYAHGHRNNAPAWDGDAARSPRPLRARAARAPLRQDRESGAFKVKPNKIVVTLKKPKDSKFKWYDLKKGCNAAVTDGAPWRSPWTASAAAEAAGLPIVEEVAAPAPAPESAAGGRVTDEELAAYGNESRPTDTSEEGEAKRPRSSSPASDAELDAYIAAGTSESKQSDPPAAAPAGDDLEAHGYRLSAQNVARAAGRRPRGGAVASTSPEHIMRAIAAPNPYRFRRSSRNSFGSVCSRTPSFSSLCEERSLEERPPSSELSNPLELAKAVPEDQEQGSWSPPPAGDGRGDLLRLRNVVSTVIDGLGQDGASPRTQRGSKDSVASLEGDDGEGKSPTKRPNRLIRQLTMRTLAKRKSRDLTGEGDSPKSPEKPEEKKNLGRMLMSAEKFEKIMQSQKLGRDHESMVNQFKLRTTPTAQQGDSSWINRALSSSKHVRVLAPRGERGESGWSHAGRVALILATLAEERDFLRDKSEEDAPRQLREQAILAFLRATCPALVAKVETHHEIADELVALRATLEDRGVFSVSTGEQHLFQCGTLEEVRAEIERLEAAEKREGWKQAVPRCMMRNWKTSTPTKEARSGARPDNGTWASLSDAVLDPDGAIARSWGALIVAAVVGQVVVVPFCLSFRAWRAFAPLAWATDALFALDVGVQLRTAFHRQVAGDAAAAAAEAQVTRSAVEWSLRRIRENYARGAASPSTPRARAPRPRGRAPRGGEARVAPAALGALRLAKVLKTFAAFKADTGPGRSRFRDTLQFSKYSNALNHWERRVEAFNEHAREDFGDDAEDAGAGRSATATSSRRWLYIMALTSVLILMGEDIDISAERELAFAIVAIIICAVLLGAAKESEIPNFKGSDLGHFPLLSPNLAKEVRLFWCRDMILNVPFFRLFPPQVVQRLVCAVRVEFYMPDDYIILVGEFGHGFFGARGAAPPSAGRPPSWGDKPGERLDSAASEASDDAAAKGDGAPRAARR
ncbi:hypothetical protein SO694_00017344 [Aureococcus anophagefferens]|uniref:Uncharacterized protein n=1 Tax=Aureococcus anophagefferens TaxID=44056 RepID=A0ABR1G2V4_AURAN